MFWAAGAQAESADDWDKPGAYVGVSGGAGFAPDVDTTITTGGVSTETDSDFDTGPVIGARAGYKFRNGLRAEGEVVYRKHDLRGTPQDYREIDVMVNLLYDFPLKGTSIRPYVGAGVGLGIAGVKGGGFKDYDRGFAWQGKLGMNYPLTRRILFNTEYSVRGTLGLDFGDDVSGTATNIDPDQVFVHTITGGFIYKFNPPPRR